MTIARLVNVFCITTLYDRIIKDFAFLFVRILRQIRICFRLTVTLRWIALMANQARVPIKRHMQQISPNFNYQPSA